VSGVGTYEDAVKDSVEVDFDGVSVRVLSVDALIRAKEAAGRPKDAAGLNELYALRDSAIAED